MSSEIDPQRDDSSQAVRKQRTKSFRKAAEKRRRDALNDCLNEVKDLLPRRGVGASKFATKERILDCAIDYIADLQAAAAEKMEVIVRLEDEIKRFSSDCVA
ncbi:hypothetical protein HDU81_001634 [Chytriomyces hyalinus]|nr:hypothetical protein HDU81_001634 [Chytriomyces hyalinus]